LRGSVWRSPSNTLTAMTYSQFICGLKKVGIEMDRKVLAAIAYDDAASFTAIVQKVQAALA
jgi:large subunit ribosomal protein L20